jgi:hypothetical protein
MAASFNLTAQLNLVGPTNTKKIAADIRREIGTITGSVKFKIDQNAAVNAGKLNSQLRKLNDTLAQTQTIAANSANSISQLGSALGGVKLSRLSSDTAKSAKGLADMGDSSAKAAKDVQVMGSELAEFGRQSGLAIRRFAAFSIVSSIVYKLNSALSSAIGNFIDFDKELVRVAQVTGKNISELDGLVNEITKLSTGLGVTSDDLIKVSSTLAQAGLSASETEQALKALALSANAPSFDSLNDTVEGSIALMRQFGIKAKDLEQALGAVNAVSAQFAVEASDIITAIQRTGGVFATASRGVSSGTDALNEFIAVFTSIRATTRESSETIATGLRTIFARIQRKDTIEALKEYGVILTDLEGKFVGPYEAIKRLSEGLSKLDPRDLGFSKIVEELGGFRQIGKVIPLIQQFATAQDALRVAQQGSGSLAADSAKAQLALANRLTKVREEFVSLIREFGKNTVLQSFLGLTLDLTGALLKLVRAGKGLFPILTLIAGMKAVSGITQFAGGFAEGVRPKTKGGGGPGIAKSIGSNIGEILTGSKTDKESQNFDKAASSIESSVGDLSNQISAVVPSITQLATSVQQHMVELNANTAALTSNTTSIDALTQAISSLNLGGGPTLNAGGIVRKFATGGLVPGSGDKDTVPAMLTPGEFVMRKTAVKGIGKDKLHKMNRYAAGGTAGGGVANVKFEEGYDGDTFLVDFTPANKPYRTRTRLEGGDAYEIKGAATKAGYNKKQIEKGVEAAKKTTEWAKAASKSGELLEAFQASNKYDTFGRPMFKSDRLISMLDSEGLLTGRFQAEKKNLGGLIQKFADGGVAQRKLGYIDYDVIANEANKTAVEEGMKQTGVSGLRLYSDYLTDLAVKARKNQDLGKLKAIYGVAGSGKTTLARGQGTDSGTLRQTERFPVLSPEDIQRATEIIVLSSSVSKKKLDELFSETDRTYTLSSSTDEERSGVRDRKASRDITGVGLENRKAGSTSSVSTDSAVGEALLEDKLGKKSVVLGRSESGRLRRKSGDELVDIIKKRIGFTWGGFAPMTAGHESIMDAAATMGIPPEDFIYLVGANEGIKAGDVSSYRTAVFDQDARVLLAKAGAGSKGAMVLPKPRDFEVPSAFDISPSTGRRQVLIPGKGSTTFVADKGPEETKKYKEAGYDVANIERAGGISGTMVRDLIMAGDLGKLQSVLSPNVYDLISNNIGRIQNRANILPSLIEEVGQTQGVKLEEVEREIKALGISRIDNKKIESDPEYAAKVEVLKELRAKRDKIKTSASFEPYKLLAALAQKQPEKYGLDLAIQKAAETKPIRTVRKAQKAALGGLIRAFADAGEVSATGGKAISTRDIISVLGIQDAARAANINASEVNTLLRVRNPNASQKAMREAIEKAYLRKTNRQIAAEQTATKKLEDSGLVFGAAGLFGNLFEPKNIDIQSDQLTKSAKVRVVAGVMKTDVAEQLESLFSSGTEDLAIKGAKLVKSGYGKTNSALSAMLDNPNAEATMQGVLLEKVIQALGGPGKSQGKGFDFPDGLKDAAEYFNLPPDIPTDAKRTLEGPSTIKDNIVTYLKNVKGYAKGGKVDYYSLEKNSGFGSREFDTLVQFAKTSDFSLDEFQAYLKQRSAYKTQNSQLMMNPSSLLRALTPESPRATQKQLDLAEQLKGEPDAGYRPILTEAQRIAASRSAIRKSALNDINNATRFAGGGLVPGVGNSDTVPAVLNAGDFVIRKGSVNKMGAGNISSISQFASGGQVPALLTPGEFVIPKERATKIGYGKLNRMNKLGKFNAGGLVGNIQKFAEGGEAKSFKEIIEAIPKATTGVKDSVVLDAMQRAAKEAGIKLSTFAANVKQASEAARNNAIAQGKSSADARKAASSAAAALIGIEDVFGKSGRKLGRSTIEASEKITSNVKKRSGLLAPIEIDSGTKKQLDGIMNQMMSKLQKSGLKPEFMNTFAASKASTLIGSGGAAGNATDLESLRKALISEFKDLRQKESATPEAERGGQVGLQLLALEKALKAIDPTLRGIMTARIGGNMAAGTTVTPTENIPNLGDTISSIDDLRSRFERLGMGISEIAPQDLSFAIKEMTQDFDKMSGVITEAEADLKAKQKTAFSAASGTAVERKGIAEQNPDVIAARQKVEQLKADRASKYGAATSAGEVESIARSETSAGKAAIQQAKAEADAQAALEAKRNQAREIGAKKASLATAGVTTGQEYEDLKFKYTRQAAADMGLRKTTVERKTDTKTKEDKADQEKKALDKKVTQGSEKARISAENLLIKAILDNTKTLRACACKDVNRSAGQENTDKLIEAVSKLDSDISTLDQNIQAKNQAEDTAIEASVSNGQDPFANDSITVPFVDMLDSLAKKSEDAGNRLNAAFSDSAGNITKLGTAAKGMADSLSKAATRTADGLASLNENFIKSKVGQAFQGLTSIKGLIGGFVGTAGLSQAADAAGGYETKVGTGLNVAASVTEFATSVAAATSQMGPFGTAVGTVVGATIGLAKGLYDAANAAKAQKIAMLEIAKEESQTKAQTDTAIFFDSMEPNVKDFNSALQNLSAVIVAENEIIANSAMSLEKYSYGGLGPKTSRTGADLDAAAKQLATARSGSAAISKDIIGRTMSSGGLDLAGAKEKLGEKTYSGLTQSIADADAGYIKTVKEKQDQYAKDIAAGTPKAQAEKNYYDAIGKAKDAVVQRTFAEQQVAKANEDFRKNVTDVRKRLESQGVGLLEKIIGNTPEQNREYAAQTKAASDLMGGDSAALKARVQKAYEEAYAKTSGTEMEKSQAGESAAAKERIDIQKVGDEILGFLPENDQRRRNAKANMLEETLKTQGVKTDTGMAKEVLASLRATDPELQAQENMQKQLDAQIEIQKQIEKNTGLTAKQPPSPTEQQGGEASRFEGANSLMSNPIIQTTAGIGLSSAISGGASYVAGKAKPAASGVMGRVASWLSGGGSTTESETPEKTKAATTAEEMDTSSKAKTNKTDMTDNSRSATGDVNTKSSRGGRAKSRGFFGAVSSYVLPAAIAGGGLAAGYVMRGGAKKPEEAQAATEETLPADPEILGLLSKIEENTRNCCSGNSQNGIIGKPLAVSAVDQSKANLLEEQLTGKGIDTNTGITKTALNSLKGGEQPAVTYTSLPTESVLATNLDTAKTTIAQEQSTLEETQPVVGTQNPKEERSSILDWTQAALDVAGLIPIVGELADGANAAIYTARAAASTDQGVRNDLLVDAGLSAAAMVPGVGMAAIGGKYIAKGAKTAMKATKASANTTRNAVKYGGAVAGEAMDYGVMNTAENVIVSGVDAVLPVSPTAATTEYAAQQVEQSQVGQQLTPTAQLTGVSRSGFSAGAAAPISGTNAPTMVSAGVLDQAKAEYDQIEAEKARQKAAAEQAAQQTMSYDSMSKQMSGNLFGELPGTPIAAPQGMTPTPSPGVISNITKPNAAGTPAIGNLAGIDPAAISEALSGTFNNFITALQNIQLPKIPETITMEGRHTVEVIINGAEALKSIDQGIREMVTDKINEAMKNINNKTEGGFGP